MIQGDYMITFQYEIAELGWFACKSYKNLIIKTFNLVWKIFTVNFLIKSTWNSCIQIYLFIFISTVSIKP